MAKSKAVRSGRRSTDLTLPSSVRCRRGDLAMHIAGSEVGKIVEVVEYYRAVQMSDGEVLIGAWQVRHPRHEPGVRFFKEDKYLLPIRPGDLDETETDEVSLVKGVSA